MLGTMSSHPLIGAQTSTAGGFAPVPERARVLGCEVVQVFSSNPRQWPTRSPSSLDLHELVAGLRRYRLPLFLHTIYLINLATPDEALRQRSVEALASALALGARTRATGVVTHIGSHRGEGAEKGRMRAMAAARESVEVAARLLTGTGESAPLPPLLLETAAGAGHSLGGTLEGIADLLAGLPCESDGPAFGLCLDTAHLFASGYPVHQPTGLEEVIAELERLGLLPRVGLIHLNDSATPFASRSDRHEKPGAGHIGYEGLAGIIKHPAFALVPFVLETPGAQGHGPDAADLAVARAMRAGKPAKTGMAAARGAGPTAGHRPARPPAG